MADGRQVVEIGGRRLTVSNLAKILWPEDGYTKGNLIDFYQRVAPYLLPHLQGRPLVVTRYPDGIYGESFYQKDLPAHAPPWVKVFPHQGEERLIHYVLCEDAATLAWLSNQACVELHPWLSRASNPGCPDLAVFDIDPATPATYRHVVEVALLIKEALARLGLNVYPKTSGATGLHLYLPIKPEYPYSVVRRFVEEVARLLYRVHPRRITLERQVNKRAGKVYIDYLQNVRGKTLAAPYSLRPLPGAPVSTPLVWAEVEKFEPANFTIATVPGRLERTGDLIEPVLTNRQELSPALAALKIKPYTVNRKDQR